MLSVESVDWHVVENAKEHRTDRFEEVHDEEPTPILRRGQPFKLSISLDRAFNDKTDTIRVFFEYGEVKKKSPRMSGLPSSNTVSRTSRLSQLRDQWSVALVSQTASRLTLHVKSPAIAAFGTWTLTIKTSLKVKPGVNTYKEKRLLYLLFNPWLKDDEVYMAETRLLDEYVLNDVGKIYTSRANKPVGKKWLFGQFSRAVLPALRKVLASSALGAFKRGSPVFLSRELTRLLADLVLQGDWSGDYSDGTPPSLWSGSASIYEDYLNKEAGDEEKVKYGQCWVFSGILTTALRAIGIPARSVTNFQSAHDTDSSMSIDEYLNKDGEVDDEANASDSVWNFHVWTDAWMARPELPLAYGGWQAVDATPQEESEGEYQCGPASLEAIKRGEIGFNYDVLFVTAEVNADKISWKCNDEDEYEVFKIDKTAIGKAVLTKRPFIYDPHGDGDFEDITDQYKYSEGTKEERLSFYNAVKSCDGSSAYDIAEEEESLTFSFQDIDSVDVGEEFNILLVIQNDGEETRTIEATLSAASVHYNGVKAWSIKRSTGSVNVKPNSEEHLSLKVKPEEYADKLVDFSLVRIHAIATVKDSNYTWAEQDHFTVNMPEIVITVKSDLLVNNEGELIFLIKNPLKQTLTDCKITYESAGIGRNVSLPVKDIKGEEEVSVAHSVTPTVSGELRLVASFDSKQLKSMLGSADIIVL